MRLSGRGLTIYNVLNEANIYTQFRVKSDAESFDSEMVDTLDKKQTPATRKVSFFLINRVEVNVTQKKIHLIRKNDTFLVVVVCFLSKVSTISESNYSASDLTLNCV